MSSFYKSVVTLAILFIAISTFYFSYETKPVYLLVSTTTSLENTGLLYALADAFRDRYPSVQVRFIPVGSGAALEIASRGDVDLVTVHAPQLEAKYLESGDILNGSIFAYNYFVIVGPKDDPAKINGTDPITAFTKIFKAGEKGEAMFVSRGDRSGTHVRELMIWNKTGLTPQGHDWYIESGLGMGDTLVMADEKNAYTLSDIGTYLDYKIRGRIENLEILVDKGDILLNIYSAYPVNPEKHPNVNYELATAFISFITSEEGQKVIMNYMYQVYGVHLFYPAEGNETYLRTMWENFAEGS